MSTSSTQGAHPLAGRVIAYAGEQTLNGPVLEVGTGSGRNTRALVAAGLEVVSVPDETPYTQLPGGRDAYAAAISTHAYLHGTSAKLRAGIAELRRVLQPGAPVFLTLGSIADDRYGLGIPFDERSFAPGDGDEAGIPHVYLDRDGVIETLFGFTVEHLDEVAVNEIAGAWAHAADDPARRVHWFVIARKNAPAAAAQ